MTDEEPQERAAPMTRSRRLALLPAVLALLLVGSVAVNVWLALDRREAAALQRAEDEALDAAREAVLALTSYDARSVDDDFSDVVDRSVDPFRSEFEEASGKLSEVIKEYNSSTEAEIVRSGVSDVSEDRVDVVFFVDQVVRSDVRPRERTDRSRIAMTMVMTESGEWKVSEANLL